MATKNTSAGGLSFGGAMTILFIGLKLAGVISWPWYWVLAPLWLPLAVILAFLAVAFPAVMLWRLLFETEQQRRARELRDSLKAFSEALQHRRGL